MGGNSNRYVGVKVYSLQAKVYFSESSRLGSTLD